MGDSGRRDRRIGRDRRGTVRHGEEGDVARHPGGGQAAQGVRHERPHIHGGVQDRAQYDGDAPPPSHRAVPRRSSRLYHLLNCHRVHGARLAGECLLQPHCVLADAGSQCMHRHRAGHDIPARAPTKCCHPQGLKTGQPDGLALGQDQDWRLRSVAHAETHRHPRRVHEAYAQGQVQDDGRDWLVSVHGPRGVPPRGVRPFCGRVRFCHDRLPVLHLAATIRGVLGRGGGAGRCHQRRAPEHRGHQKQTGREDAGGGVGSRPGVAADLYGAPYHAGRDTGEHSWQSDGDGD
mmetsp:Transcript_10021/g.41561  ORF Transcript_10021/g.41561 Transcript_10021/m.41561 type:complete len:291 (+) Transcript_10021:727-1599(+)